MKEDGERERETTFLSPGSTFLTSLASFDAFSSLAVNIFQSILCSSYFHVATGTKLHTLSELHEHHLWYMTFASLKKQKKKVASRTKEQNKAYQSAVCLGQKITDMLLGDCLALICAQRPGRLNNGGLGLFLLSEVRCLSQAGTFV